jgi:predicted DNA-binding transcriptional regulator AlpA
VRRRLNQPNPPPKRHHLDRRAFSIAAASEGPADELIDSRELAAWLGMSLTWVEAARMNGDGPRFIKTGARSIRYRRSDVLQWLEERTRQATAGGR